MWIYVFERERERSKHKKPEQIDPLRVHVLVRVSFYAFSI
jgi:hypothetical protein